MLLGGEEGKKAPSVHALNEGDHREEAAFLLRREGRKVASDFLGCEEMLEAARGITPLAGVQSAQVGQGLPVHALQGMREALFFRAHHDQFSTS